MSRKPFKITVRRISKGTLRVEGKRRLSKLRGSGDLKPMDTDPNYKRQNNNE